MGKETAIITVAHDQLPDVHSACDLVREIAGKAINHEPRKVDKPLVLYGAGNLGRLAASYFKHIGISFQLVVDANAVVYNDDPFWQGTSIVRPEDVQVKDKESSILAICISTAPISPIYKSLADQGWQDIVPFYDIAEAYSDLHPLSNGWFTGKLQPAEISGMEWVLERWHDDTSRAHHLQFLAWRALREEWRFAGAPVTIDDRYFIEPVKAMLDDHECFLDIGAHHGEISVKFANLVCGKFEAIYAVEPDQDNLLKLRENLDQSFIKEQKKRVHILDSVVGDRCCINKIYAGLDYATQLCSYGNRIVNVQTIDSLSLSPTIIKLHVEGSELHSFVGGLETIRKSRPIIMATIYHNELGIYRFPQLLMQCLDDYKFYLRLHGWCGTGLVMYALPLERLSNNYNKN